MHVVLETPSYANFIVVSLLSARGNSCYMLHELEWCYSELYGISYLVWMVSGFLGSAHGHWVTSDA